MQLYFRELNSNDIPAINEISKDIWEGDDYVPQVIQRWLQEKDCMNYGTFIDKDTKGLIGFGRVKFFPNSVAWLEGGRVRVSYQKKGVGREQLRYAIEYASKSGAKIAQYDTSSRNIGSLALAKHFGFQQKKRMEVLSCKRDEVKFEKKIFSGIDKISLKEAKQFYRKTEIGPGDEVCIGWSYVPIDYLLEKNSSWIHKNNAILQTIKLSSAAIQEGPDENDLWMITYGDAKDAFDLILYAISNQMEQKSTELFEIFCNSDVVKSVQDIGFSYWENEPIGVVLVEKSLVGL